KDDKKKQTIYALSGKKWHFKAEPEAKSAVVAMEVMDDGNLLVMERSYTGILDPFVVTLKKVFIRNCKQNMCDSKVLLKMNSHKGWDVDNFEGLAKVGKNRYVMVSDNGDNFFQKTLLVYFEVVE
ncbi:MAG TPA: esterase-like activity of phytase family protein, partial [Epsilonproteobacteria bacterium]|nr:esterase-like activity of phytase family protein [Campylobacterota bacterium]